MFFPYIKVIDISVPVINGFLFILRKQAVKFYEIQTGEDWSWEALDFDN
jgi:hypothetical protein